MEQMEIEEDQPAQERTSFCLRLMRKHIYLWIGIFLFAYFAFWTMIAYRSPESSKRFCQTPECSSAAMHLINFVNTDEDPCEDFYRFACGNSHKISEQYDISLSQQVSFLLPEIHLIDDKEIDETTWKLTKNLKLAREFYRECMNVTSDRERDSTFLKTMDYLTGGWSDNLTDHKYESWQHLMLKSRNVGLHFEFFLDVNITVFPDTYLQISPPNLDQFKMYHKIWSGKNEEYLQKILQHWGYNSSSLYWEFNETMHFANRLMDVVVSGNLDMKFMKPKIVIQKISNLNKTRGFDQDWLPFLQNLTGVNDLVGTESIYFQIKSDSDQNYLTKLTKLIETTPRRHWVNYLIAYNIIRDNKHLSITVRSLVNTMLGWTNEPRKVACLLETGRYFSKDIDKAAIHNILTDEKVKSIKTMYNYISKALEKYLKQTFAANETLREGSMARLDNITLIIGATEHFFNETMFDEAFGTKPDILSGNSLEMLHVLEKNKLDHYYSLIRKPTGYYNRELSIDPKAFFVIPERTIYLLAPMLQDPIFSLNRPEYLNYGSLGTIIAHEMLHAFDNTILKQLDALSDWQIRMREQRRNSQECALESYGKYYHKLFNSSSTVSVDIEEVLSDLSSVNIAYLAYVDYVNATGTEEELEAVPYNPYQIFWIMTSTFLCDNKQMEETEAEWLKPKYAINRMHPLPSYRVNGPKVNSQYFAKYFNCELGTNMNPTKKCSYFP